MKPYPTFSILTDFFTQWPKIFFFLLFIPQPSFGQEPILTLQEVLKNCKQNNAQIQESKEDIEIARAQWQRAYAAAFPRGEVLILGAPIFEETGDALYSQSNWNRWGPILSGSISIFQPLYTFGQIGNYQKAATHQIEAKNKLSEKTVQEILLQAKEFYYGFQMATELEKLVNNLIDFLEEAVKTAESSKRKNKKNGVKPHDLFKLRTALEDLKQKKLLAVQGKKTAQQALRWISHSSEENFRPSPLRAEEMEKKEIDFFTEIAKKNRPEFIALQEGIAAREALSLAKQAQSYPTILIGGFFSYAWSPVRTRQHSMFINDPFNGVRGGIGLGLRLDLEFWRHAAESAEENAQKLKLKALEKNAIPGIDLQVKKSYWEWEQATKGLEIAEKRKEIAKKWFIQNAMGWSIGITAAKDILESLEGDGLAKKNYIESVYALNIALARLSQAVGKEVTTLQY